MNQSRQLASQKHYQQATAATDRTSTNRRYIVIGRLAYFVISYSYLYPHVTIETQEIKKKECKVNNFAIVTNFFNFFYYAYLVGNSILNNFYSCTLFCKVNIKRVIRQELKKNMFFILFCNTINLPDLVRI